MPFVIITRIFTLANQGIIFFVICDDKVYQHLQSLKLNYAKELSWLILSPGDFHILMNHQPNFSKVHFDAGLKQITLLVASKGRL